MELKSLKLINFQGIKSAKFDFDGDTSIYGDNGVGKTTIFNAVTWLLFDKASTGAKGFTPKTKGLNGEDLHYLEHGVEACIILCDGRQITLKKIYKEKYSKKRGSTFEEFDGHINEYYIDGVPAKEKEYIDALSNYIAPAERMKLLMIPNYFSEELAWSDRRQILLDICGDVSDLDVIESNKELKDLAIYLAIPGKEHELYSVDEYKKIASSKCAKLKKDLESIPARIDEANKALPDMSNIDISKIDEDILVAYTKIEDYESEKKQIKFGSVDEITKKQILAFKEEMLDSETMHINEQSMKNESVYNKIRMFEDVSHENEKLLIAAEKLLFIKNTDLSNMKELREKLINEHSVLFSEVWHGNADCYACKRPLPEAEIAKAIEEFNLDKSNRLEAINKKGHKLCSKDMIASLEAETNSLVKEIEAYKNKEQELEKSILVAKSELQIIPFKSTEIYQRLNSEIENLQNNKNVASIYAEKLLNEIDEKIQILRLEVSELTSEKSKFDIAKQQKERIKELEDNEKKSSQELENLQRGLYLCETFIKTKVDMLTDNINSKFEAVRFRLFEEQINGGIKEGCEVMVPGENRLVPYATANNAARINAGLEIIDALSTHWGISLPVFIDNCESIVSPRKINSQLIKLYVSAGDDTLRLESGEEEMFWAEN